MGKKAAIETAHSNTPHEPKQKKKSRLVRELESSLPSGAKDYVLGNIAGHVHAHETELAPFASHVFVISTETEKCVLDLLW